MPTPERRLTDENLKALEWVLSPPRIEYPLTTMEAEWVLLAVKEARATRASQGRVDPLSPSIVLEGTVEAYTEGRVGINPRDHRPAVVMLDATLPQPLKPGERVMLTIGPAQSSQPPISWNYDMEQAPKDGTRILVAYEGHTGKRFSVYAMWLLNLVRPSGGYGWFAEVSGYQLRPYAWMPDQTPEAPPILAAAPSIDQVME